jgi:nucleotide-binding universal stress UspA family protein
MKVLIPVNSSRNCQFAVRHAVRRFMNDGSTEIHLMNVQRPFSRYLAHFASKRTVHEYHRAESERALRPCRDILDGFGIPYAVHIEIGELAERITDKARRLHCDEIVMGTARKSSLTRLFESSITNRVLEQTSVPVEVVAGDSESPWERYGILAALAALLALLFAAAD